jgi:hypothetical protein
MTKQPVALRLADEMSKYRITDESVLQTATELRRLHEVNQELVEALKWAVDCLHFSSDMPEAIANLNKAYQAIAKATGEQA